MKSTVKKVFLDITEEENWLNEQGEQGKMLIGYSNGVYEFEDVSPAKFQYKIDIEASNEEWAEHNQTLLYENIRSESIKQLVAKDGEKIVGSANIIVKNNFFEIDNLYIAPEYRNRGIAKHIINFAINNERKENVILVVDANDTPKYMYESMDFSKISEQDFYLKTNV